MVCRKEQKRMSDMANYVWMRDFFFIHFKLLWVMKQSILSPEDIVILDIFDIFRQISRIVHKNQA